MSFSHTPPNIFHTAEILRYQSNDLVVSIACQALITICFMAYYFHAFEMRVFRYIIITRTTTTTTRQWKISFGYRCCPCMYIYSKAEISLHSMARRVGDGGWSGRKQKKKKRNDEKKALLRHKWLMVNIILSMFDFNLWCVPCIFKISSWAHIRSHHKINYII